jgi:hypothetical protein
MAWAAKDELEEIGEVKMSSNIGNKRFLWIFSAICAD